MALAESKTLQNLKDAFAGESQANRRYLYFAQKADVEGYKRRSPPCSAPPPKARPATPTATWEFTEEVGDSRTRPAHRRHPPTT